MPGWEIGAIRLRQRALGRKVQVEEAGTFAANVLAIIASLRASVVRDLRGLAAVLNNRGVRTARGGRWHVVEHEEPGRSTASVTALF